MPEQFEWTQLDLQGKNGAAVELVGFAGCPCLPAIRSSLAEALGGKPFKEVDQHTLPPDDPRRGYPSPTILVNGRDLFGLPEPDSPTMGCRQYPGGLPDAPTLVARLRELR